MRGKLPPLLACVIGAVTGIYTFQPLLAQDALEKQIKRQQEAAPKQTVADPTTASSSSSSSPSSSSSSSSSSPSSSSPSSPPRGANTEFGKPAKAVIVDIKQQTAAEAAADQEDGLWERIVGKR